MARPTRRPGNLPAEATSFIGRRSELAEVRAKLADARLVSLVGPGGVGKTRLAIRAATNLGRGFRDGTWLAELAEVGDPALVGSAVMAALDLRDQASADPWELLVSYLRDKEVLLVVDNCEHLLGAAAQVITDLMKAAPGVRVIATSREPLSAPGEHVVPVPPLDLPSPTAEPLAQLRHNEAVMLFTERAAAASGTFELTAVNQPAVTDLCRRLDGLPLAIELAAVRTRVLTVEQIRDRLTDRFALLTGGSRAALPRHQTLRTAIEWSHDLLSDGERTVLRRLSVFAGRFSLEDVESVCAPTEASGTQALDLLSGLVDKSLLMKEDSRSVACYRLHETMREFARLQLTEAGEDAAIERRCTDYYQLMCLRSTQEGRYLILDWLEWADLEIDNIRAVLQRLLIDGDLAAGAELSTALGWYWITRATTEGIRWLDEFLGTGDGAADWLGWAYFIRGFLAVLKADPEQARPALRAAVAAGRQAGGPALLSEALAMASIAENMAGNDAAARHLLADARAAVTGVDYPPGAISVLQAETLNGFFTGDFRSAKSAASQGVRLARAANDRYTLEMMQLNLGSAALLTGDLSEARPLLEQALILASQIDDRVGQFYLLDALGCHAALTGNARRAAQLFGAADTARTEAGANVMRFFAPLYAKARESAVGELGASRFAAAFDTGRHLGRDTAIGLALGQPAPSAAGTSPGADTGMLGKREAEVARLVAEGMTNRQVGARLFISERTVDSHVRSIMNKLGVSSRAQIAGWIAAQRR
jgi:predicted ATPase/DNA-binding CsgD family transcriptional regulator